MTTVVVLLRFEQRAEVAAATEDFTCRGERHIGDMTTENGDAFLESGAWADLDEGGITRTWAAVVDGEIGGYISLAADAVTLTRSERRGAALEGAHLSRYGCTQIAMVAVRADLHGCGIGTALIEHAVLIGTRTGDNLGARFLAADVNPPAAGFYERCGFISLAGEGPELLKKREKGLLPMVRDLRPRS